MSMRYSGIVPRGVRAIHDVNGSTSNGRDQVLVAYSVSDTWLVATCWCERCVVGVPQHEIVDLQTRSCGQDGCLAPDGSSPVPGLRVQGDSTILDGEYHVSKLFGGEYDQPFSERPYHRPARVRKVHKEQISDFDLAIRRDRIKILWRMGKTANDIARLLEVPLYKIQQDLLWLRSRDKILNRPGRIITRSDHTVTTTQL